MPFGPGTYPPGDPRNEMPPSASAPAASAMQMLGVDTDNPLIRALLMMLAGGTMVARGMQPPGVAAPPGAVPPGVATPAPTPTALLNFLRNTNSGQLS